jgi:choline dehydrogenase
VTIEGKKAVGVEYERDGRLERAVATREVVLSMGAFNTPRTLVLSGIGDAAELKRLGVPLVEHLPGVGRNFQDHTMVSS